MRLDGALEPRPRQGAATIKGRQPLRRETREPCETQQQQPADEDDEATDAECLTTNSSSSSSSTSSTSSNNCQANLVCNPKRTTSATPTPRKTTGGRGNTRHTILMAPNVGHQRKSLGLRLPMKQGRSRRRMMGAEWGWERLNGLLLCLISVIALLPPLTLGDDGDNFFAVNAFSAGPETTTPEFDYASRGQKKFGDKCDNTLECGFPGSICDPKKKSCQCTEDLPVTNHYDKCGKEAAVNESCFFNEQCEMRYFQTECRDGRCICRFEMSPIWGKDGSVECKGRQDKRGPETYIDPAMIGVLVGMALMFVIICVVLRLFSQARWRENRTIFNTPNPRLMNVSLLRDSKLLHGQERRGSRMSVRAPSRQPSMASLRPHSPNPSLGKTGRMIRSKSNTRSSDSRVSDVSTCSRLLEHPSAASQHNLVHSHFLPYVPTTTASTATATNAIATYAASATPSPTPTPPPSAGHQLPMGHANATSTTSTANTTTTTTTYVSPAGIAPACGRTNKF
uniref:GH08757p n=1 Tax=Drosophila melanogaster TaxID=7227 RepID=Q32KC6_DROME|nr:julius seizure, isoform C [Drosophila melanogaster]ABB36457.1 GH08757p [Drosophila melanogaster]ABW08799.1 julius seizure, isoform C [Drosophila melanogaster]AOQ14179.1 CG14509-PC [synthetic construct]|eukprot:NP_001097963.1 julius seizure, isoform C [Drosophila melanogaster]